MLSKIIGRTFLGILLLFFVGGKQNGKRDRAGSVWQCPECGEEEDMDSAAKHYWEFHYE